MYDEIDAINQILPNAPSGTTDSHNDVGKGPDNTNAD
jgi:hypothetical protein